MKQELITLLAQKAFKYSDEPIFKLASGKQSSFYVNCRSVTLSAKGMNLVGHLVHQALQSSGAVAIGGLTFGADPIAVATAFASLHTDFPVDAFSIRKQQKDHGIVRWIEGDILPKSPVVIVDDVATTGASTVTAIERAREEGLNVVKAIVLVDRQEGGLENIQKYVNDVCAIVTREELLRAYQALGK